MEKSEVIQTVIFSISENIKYRGYLIFFGVRSIFISPNGHQKLYFHASPRVKIPLGVHE